MHARSKLERRRDNEKPLAVAVIPVLELVVERQARELCADTHCRSPPDARVERCTRFERNAVDEACMHRLRFIERITRTLENNFAHPVYVKRLGCQFQIGARPAAGKMHLSVLQAKRAIGDGVNDFVRKVRHLETAARRYTDVIRNAGSSRASERATLNRDRSELVDVAQDGLFARTHIEILPQERSRRVRRHEKRSIRGRGKRFCRASRKQSTSADNCLRTGVHVVPFSVIDFRKGTYFS